MEHLKTGTTGTLAGAGSIRYEGAREESPETLERVLADGVSQIDEPGQYLVFDEGGETRVHELGREWTRIGRSLVADVRLDDPTISRRHALIVRGPDGLRVLDDRSLNGVFVNGERVEWQTLSAGDEVVVGRYRLHFVDVPGAPLADAPERELEEA